MTCSSSWLGKFVLIEFFEKLLPGRLTDVASWHFICEKLFYLLLSKWRNQSEKSGLSNALSAGQFISCCSLQAPIISYFILKLRSKLLRMFFTLIELKKKLRAAVMITNWHTGADDDDWSKSEVTRHAKISFNFFCYVKF